MCALGKIESGNYFCNTMALALVKFFSGENFPLYSKYTACGRITYSFTIVGTSLFNQIHFSKVQ